MLRVGVPEARVVRIPRSCDGGEYKPVYWACVNDRVMVRQTKAEMSRVFQVVEGISYSFRYEAILGGWFASKACAETYSMLGQIPSKVASQAT